MAGEACTYAIGPHGLKVQAVVSLRLTNSPVTRNSPGDLMGHPRGFGMEAIFSALLLMAISVLIISDLMLLI